jgi:hypothetical protein
MWSMKRDDGTAGPEAQSQFMSLRLNADRRLGIGREGAEHFV